MRKIKEVVPVEEEPGPIVEPPVVVEAAVEPTTVEEVKSKRKYTRIAPKLPDTIPGPVDPVTEPVKRSPGTLIEEMQRVERALRYQMRKNKMKLLVSQAF